jgi:hypothetical protein
MHAKQRLAVWCMSFAAVAFALAALFQYVDSQPGSVSHWRSAAPAVMALCWMSLAISLYRRRPPR